MNIHMKDYNGVKFIKQVLPDIFYFCELDTLWVPYTCVLVLYQSD